MLLNVDRKRLYIYSGVGVFLILMIGLYHAPAYVPAEVSRMKTSVSTWLKGTEPSLNDEMYKDSPHFSPTTQTWSNEADEPVEDPYSIKENEEAFHILPIETGQEEQPDLLPPGAIDDHKSNAPLQTGLPTTNDFIDILPPINMLTAALTAAPTNAADSVIASIHGVNPHMEEMSSPAAEPTHIAHNTHPHMQAMSSPEPERTTFATHASAAAANMALPSNIREEFDEGKWGLEDLGGK